STMRAGIGDIHRRDCLKPWREGGNQITHRIEDGLPVALLVEREPLAVVIRREVAKKRQAVFRKPVEFAHLFRPFGPAARRRVFQPSASLVPSPGRIWPLIVWELPRRQATISPCWFVTVTS